MALSVFISKLSYFSSLTASLICLTRLLQRYQNVKAELEAQQNLERIRMEKLAQSGGLTSVGNNTKKKMGGSSKRTTSA